MVEDPVPQVASVALWSLYQTESYAALAEIVARLDLLHERGGIPLADARDILARATGQEPRDVPGWKEWWAQQKELPETFPRPRGARRTGVGTFFGHRIYSRHVAFVLDISGSMSYAGPGQWRKYDHAASLAAAMTYLALKQQDRVALSLFDDQPRRALSQLGTCTALGRTACQAPAAVLPRRRSRSSRTRDDASEACSSLPSLGPG